MNGLLRQLFGVLWVFFFACALTGGPNAAAHQLRFSSTDMQWRADLGRIEIAHALHLDDAMLMLAQLGDRRGELDLTARANLMLHVAEQFTVHIDEQPIAAEAVGTEFKGDFLGIYQELPLQSLPTSLSVRCTLLHQLFDDAINQVNLNLGGAVISREFTREVTEQSF